MVASTHWIASGTAMGILERGGNAFDAAAAAGFVLHLAEPHLNGPGGDLTALIRPGSNQRIAVLCGQGVAPRRASIDHLRSLGLHLVPGSGLLAACVPGAVDAWLLLLRDHGSLELAEVLAPALQYARGGCPLVPQAVAMISRLRAWFLQEWPTSAAAWLPNGEPPPAWSPFPRPALAATYERLLAEAQAGGHSREQRIEAARRAWREGFVAEAIDRFCAGTAVNDETGERQAALLEGADLAGWQASWEQPLSLGYGDWQVAKCGPWSQGPVLLQQLALLRGFVLDDLPPDGPDFVHLLTEAGKLAFADREAWYGDPARSQVPIESLLGEAYNASRRWLISDRASLELRPGAPLGQAPRLGRAVSQAAAGIGSGEPTCATPPGDTCHVAVVDRWGNMVAATPSGGWLQSSPMIPELGFCLGTRAQMFRLEEGLPSALAPGRRPLTTLSPTLAWRGEEEALAFGTPGGDQQDQWSLQFFLKLVHHGMGLQQAIDSPAWHSEHAPSSFHPRQARPGHLALESRLPEPTQAELQRRGHRVEIRPPWSEGRLCACALNRTGGTLLLRAAANPRLMQNYAVGR